MRDSACSTLPTQPLNRISIDRMLSTINTRKTELLPRSLEEIIVAHTHTPSLPPYRAACALLDRLGAQYEADHEEELRERRTYLAPELLGMGRLTPGVARALEGAGPGTDLPPPPPFTGRPRLGTRILCQVRGWPS